MDQKDIRINVLEQRIHTLEKQTTLLFKQCGFLMREFHEEQAAKMHQIEKEAAHILGVNVEVKTVDDLVNLDRQLLDHLAK